MSCSKTVILAGLVIGMLGLNLVSVSGSIKAGQTLAQTVEQQKTEADHLLEQGNQQHQIGQYQAALKSWEQALVIYQRVKYRNGEAAALLNLGLVHVSLSQHQKAIDYFQRSLSVYEQIQNQNGKAGALANLGTTYQSLSQYEKAIGYFLQALPIFQQLQNQNAEVLILNKLGIAYLEIANYEKAIVHLQQALPIWENIKDLQRLAETLTNLGIAYRSLSQYEKAISYYQQALPILMQIKDHNNEAKVLNNLGIAYWALSQYEKAISYYQQALPVFVQINDSNSQASLLMNLGIAYRSLSQYEKAISYYQQALPLFMQSKDRKGAAKTLMHLGAAYDSLGQYEKAITYYQEALPILIQVKDRNSESITLSNLGNAYLSLSQYEKAIGYYQQALFISVQVKNRNSEAEVLTNLGNAYGALSEYEKAISHYQNALSTFQQIKNRNGEAQALASLGGAYRTLAEYGKAISYYQQALPIFVQVKDRVGEGGMLNRLGNCYRSLAQYEKAISYHQKALFIFQQIKSSNGEAEALVNLGSTYQALSEYEKAISYYQQALPIFVQIKNRAGEAAVLNNLGNTYFLLSKYEKAISYFQQALPIFKQVKARNSEAIVMANLGSVSQSNSPDQKTNSYYQEALSSFQQTKSRELEAGILSNLGSLFAKRKQPEIAIVFYKQSVNVRQTIREGIRQLPRESQESYTESVAGTYRALADLLLSQGRIAEAQQVLELLKLQELRDYSRETRTGDAPTSIALDQSEQEILKAHSSIVAFAQAIQQCHSDSTCANSQTMQTLVAQRDRQNTIFTQLVKTLETQIKPQLARDIALINPNDPNYGLRRRAEEILNAQPGTLLIYPLVLENKMWLLVGSPGPVFTRYEVPVEQKELAKTILQFRTEMKRCETMICTQADTNRVKQISQKLYQWLFPLKLQKELQAVVKQPIQNLVFAPDRSTRYIPMAALFDGKKYLTERYTISTIVAASKTDTGARLPNQPSVLGMGVSKALSGFNALPNVQNELKAIVKTKQSQDNQGIFPGNEFLDEAFTKSKLRSELSNYQILHLATHGKFEPGAIDHSFLLLGDETHFKPPDIRELQGLAGVHLVVLSACETALGGRHEQDGIEIAGINNAFLQRGAKAVVASLWQVNDPSTSVWMQQFYQNLARGNLTKSQAMQQVQINFLRGQFSLQESQRLRAGARRFHEGGGQADLTHPFYWAPFILTGNAL